MLEAVLEFVGLDQVDVVAQFFVMILDLRLRISFIQRCVKLDYNRFTDTTPRLNARLHTIVQLGAAKALACVLKGLVKGIVGQHLDACFLWVLSQIC